VKVDSSIIMAFSGHKTMAMGRTAFESFGITPPRSMRTFAEL